MSQLLTSVSVANDLASTGEVAINTSRNNGQGTREIRKTEEEAEGEEKCRRTLPPNLDLRGNVASTSTSASQAPSSIIARGAAHIAKKPCRTLLFSSFVAVLMIIVYIVYMLLTHFTQLFTSPIFWNNLKDVVTAARNCSRSSKNEGFS